MFHHILLVAVALVLCLPDREGLAGSSSTRYGSASYLTATKKPAPKPRAANKTANKRTNFRPAKLNCRPGTMTWHDLLLCGYDVPPSWAIGPAGRRPAVGYWSRD